MIKKLWVLAVAIFVLIGCNESKKEVTADILVGKWNCKNTINKTMEFNADGTSGEYKESELRPDQKNEYFKSGNDLILKDKNHTEVIDLQSIRTMKDQWVGSSYDEERKIDIGFIFISNDKHKIFVKVIYRNKESKQNKNEFYLEYLCERTIN